MKQSSLRLRPRQQPAAFACAMAAALTLLSAAGTAQAQTTYPVTPQQRATAQQAASQGVPLSELAPKAPDEYTVRRGDTLWSISRMYLKSPWRWPELWGMNMSGIADPHRIYPGQVLYLDKSGGRARLSTRRGGGAGEGGTIKLSPRTRFESAADLALPTLNPSLIEPFLTEPEVVDEESTLTQAPRIVAGTEDRVMMTRGDRLYARGGPNEPLVETAGPLKTYRVFRGAKALKDPVTSEVLGYEAQYLGKVQLQRGESTETTTPKVVTPVTPPPPSEQPATCGDCPDSNTTVASSGDKTTALPPGVTVVPATLDVIAAREEIRAGDRLLQEPPRKLISYAPRAPQQVITDGRIVSIYGEAVSVASQNQVVAINKGERDGLESGHVLAILKNGATIVDRTGATRETLKLPNERIGLLMVFRTFTKVSYALVLEITDTPRAGDLLANP